MKYILIIAGIIIIIFSQLYYLNYYPGSETVVYDNSRENSSTSSISLAGNFDNSDIFSIMTYNMNYGTGPDNNYNLENIAEVIIESGADIIGLNEVDYHLFRTNFERQVPILADNLHMNYAYGPNLKTGWGSYGNALLTSYTIIETDNIRLPGKLLKEPRGLLFNTLLLPDGSRIHVLVTHLATDYKMRQEQLIYLEKIISGLKYPFIVMGDFNEEIKELSGLKSAGNNPLKSFPSFAPAATIDGIFASPHFQIQSVRTINSEASDHLPVISGTRYTPVFVEK